MNYLLLLRFAVLAVALMVLAVIPAGSFSSGMNNHISLLKSPGLNISVDGVNASMKFFNGGIVNFEGSSMSYNSTWNLTKLGFLNFTYESRSIEYFSLSNLYPSLTINYSGSLIYYINTTIFIHPVKSNIVYNSGQNQNLTATHNNTISITYVINIHRVLPINFTMPKLTDYNLFNIVVPQVFFFGNLPLPKNLSYTGSGEHFNGFNITFGSHSILYAFNRTYFDNGVQREAEMEFRSLPHSLILGLIFSTNSSYTNISYDPYVISPSFSLSSFNVSGPLSPVINYLVDNSIYLTLGLFGGIAVIGTGYASFRKSRRL